MVVSNALASNVKASSQPGGTLSGRVVFTSGGHGWTWGKNGWYTQRNVSHEMNEDYGNLDQMNHFVTYIFNAGATVAPLRPVGHQTNEVVLDNNSSSVKFSGQWFPSRSSIYFGQASEAPYQFAPIANVETATAVYTPPIPAAGFYPVYTWVRHGADRTSQLYRIIHTGGETQVRVPHHMVGNGWVYLGTYYFDRGANAKRGAVIVSNLQPSPSVGSVVVADAIRFGNGMGDFIPDQDAPKSSYPREEEASRYWVARSLGQGQSASLYDGSGDDQSDNVGAPPRMAREMNRETEGNIFKRIFISFHSNAGGGRGVTALWNNPKLFPGTQTPNQERLAELMGREVNDTFSALSSPPLEVPWLNRSNRIIYARNDYAFGEINNRYIQDEFDATILEVAFHDHKEDAKLLRDPKVRDLTGLCSYRAVVRYMNEFDRVPLRFLPPPPRHVRAQANGNEITISWKKPESDAANAPYGYVIYQSENGYGFGNPIQLSGDKTTFAMPARPNSTLYFRIVAVNEAGESLPSEVVGCRPAGSTTAPKVLFVNGFTEFSRFTNPRQIHAKTNYTPVNAFGGMERVIPRLNNAFDYIVPHGEALAANGAAFDSSGREAVADGSVALENYQAIIWAAGNQRTETLASTEQKQLAKFRRDGGHIFLSGAHLLEDLSARFGHAENFLEQELGIFGAGPVVNSNRVALMRNSLFFWRNNLGAFGRGVDHRYFVARADTFVPLDDRAQIMLRYRDDESPAAIRSKGIKGQGNMVYFAFPFETISSSRSRNRLMNDVLEFLF